MADIEHQEDEGSIVQTEGQLDEPSHESTAAAASLQARQRCRIAQLEEKLETLEAGRASKERYSHRFIDTKLALLAIRQAVELLFS
jgi:uncharacterized protein YigA (DUF484 family)